MDFAVAHIFGIIAIFVIIVSAIGGYYNKGNPGTTLGDNIEDVEPTARTAPLRIQHYKFAHVIMKDMFFENLDELLKYTLSSDDELRGLWFRVGDYYSEEYENVKPLNAEGLKVFAKEFENKLFVVVQMPTPNEGAEAYYIGMIIPRDKSVEDSRYITLEYGTTSGEVAAYTVLGEWTKNGEHLNYGAGPDPTIDAFKDLLISKAEVSVTTWADAK